MNRYYLVKEKGNLEAVLRNKIQNRDKHW